MDFEVIGQAVENAKIKVVGVGGGGGNAVIHMINHNIEGVDFICANTDTQALSTADGAITLKLGNGLTKGLGAGEILILAEELPKVIEMLLKSCLQELI